MLSPMWGAQRVGSGALPRDVRPLRLEIGPSYSSGAQDAGLAQYDSCTSFFRPEASARCGTSLASPQASRKAVAVASSSAVKRLPCCATGPSLKYCSPPLRPASTWGGMVPSRAASSVPSSTSGVQGASGLPPTGSTTSATRRKMSASAALMLLSAGAWACATDAAPTEATAAPAKAMKSRRDSRPTIFRAWFKGDVKGDEVSRCMVCVLSACVGSEGVDDGLLHHADPLGLGEFVQVGRAAKAPAVARGAHATKGH